MSAIARIGLIKNPLTIIAMFAVIAEVSGAVVLPFIGERVQETYVWFLMIFPGLLVFLFFITLWCARDSLYGPSDFQNEKHFVDLIRPATVKEVALKSVVEAMSEVPDGANSGLGDRSQPPPASGRAGSSSGQCSEGQGESTPPTGAAEPPACERTGAVVSSPAVIAAEESTGAADDLSANEMAVIREARLRHLMGKRAYMRKIALSKVTQKMADVRFDMKVGDAVVDAVSVHKGSVKLFETHYVSSRASPNAALADLSSVLDAAKAFRVSAEDTEALSVVFVLYSELERELGLVYSALTRQVAAANYRWVDVSVVPISISKNALLEFEDLQ